jgi:hypothetical protein
MRNQLEAAFGNCKYPKTCTCNIKDSFEVTSQKQFFIIDEEGEVPVRIVSEKGRSHLSIQNEFGKEICLVKTDNCLLMEETKVCDCILFDDKQLVLAELKASNSGTRPVKRKKAREQLIATIELLQSKGIDVKNYRTVALICFKSHEPRIINSADNTQRANFFQNYKVHLEEKNVLSFN